MRDEVYILHYIWEEGVIKLILHSCSPVKLPSCAQHHGAYTTVEATNSKPNGLKQEKV